MPIQHNMLCSSSKFLQSPFLSSCARHVKWRYPSYSRYMLITAAHRASTKENNGSPQAKYKCARFASSTSGQPKLKQSVFYRWPTMRHFRFISRFKVYQVSTMLLLLLPMGWWYNVGGISGQTLTYALISSIGTTGVLTVLSYYFTHVAGELALIHDKSLIRISTLTFMGGRRDVIYPLSKIVPFSDSQSKVGGAIQRLEVIGERDVYLYSLRYGRVIDSTVMCRILSIKTL